MKHRRIDAILLIILFLCFAMGCSSGDESIETINVGILPHVAEARLHHIYQPLLDHFTTQMDINFTLNTPASYEQLLDWLNNPGCAQYKYMCMSSHEGKQSGMRDHPG